MAETQAAVDPANAAGAQIPLQSFHIPTFPPEARGLKALTLTSDIKLDEYSNLLSQPCPPVPPLPPSIESLTLELFSLGYPPGFLAALGKALPNVKSLVVYSQLLAGVSDESREDAERFFENLKGSLRALHLLDVFAQPGFFHRVGQILSPSGNSQSGQLSGPRIQEEEEQKQQEQEQQAAVKPKGLLFLEVNYTSQPRDPSFRSRIPGADLPALIGPSLISCALNISPPERTDDPQDPSNLDAQGNPIEQEKDNETAKGVVALQSAVSEALVDALTGQETKPGKLKVLNSTLFGMSLEQLRRVFGKEGIGGGLLVVNVAVEMEEAEKEKDSKDGHWMRDVLHVIVDSCPLVEQIEIVALPAEKSEQTKNQKIDAGFPSRHDMMRLEKKVPNLTTFKGNILRNSALGVVMWNREADQETRQAKSDWRGGIIKP